jgi:peroxiredoxin
MRDLLSIVNRRATSVVLKATSHRRRLLALMTAPMTATRPPRAGDTAPDFTLIDTTRTPVTLSEQRGRSHVLLAFFPAAFSSVCTEEFCGVRDTFDEYARRDVTVYGISVDSHHALREFKKMHGLRSEFLSDFKREVATQYGVLIPDRLTAHRAYFLIDKLGIIRWAHVEDTPATRRENADLVAALAKLD